LLRDPKGHDSLARLAKQTAPILLVTSIGLGDGIMHSQIAEPAIF
jgi:hypothetical protein